MVTDRIVFRSGRRRGVEEGWTALHLIVQLYVVLAPRNALYGARSGIIILLTSLNAATMLLLLGAIVNWSYSLNRP